MHQEGRQEGRGLLSLCRHHLSKGSVQGRLHLYSMEHRQGHRDDTQGIQYQRPSSLQASGGAVQLLQGRLSAGTQHVPRPHQDQHQQWRTVLRGSPVESPALSLVLSIWGNLTQWREHQDWAEADLKYRALKMVLPSDDPNVRYIEKNFSVCPNKEVIEKVRTHVNIYEDSIRYHNEMIQMAAIKDSMANNIFKEANEIKKKINQK